MLSRLIYFTLTRTKHLFIWLFYMQVIIMAKVVYHFPATPVLLLLPHCLAHQLKVVLLSTLATFLPYAEHYLGGVLCHSICNCPPSCLPLMIVYLILCVFNNVNVFCLLYFIKGLSVPFALLPYDPIAKHTCLLHHQYPLVRPHLLEFYLPSHHHWSPLINCSVINLSYSLYWHSAALLLNPSFQSCVHSLFFI